MYGLDAEWDGYGNLRLAVAAKIGKKVSYHEIRPGDKPIVIHDTAAYYMAYDDVVLTRDLVRFDKYVDANVLVNMVVNESTYEKGGELQRTPTLYDRCLNYLGIKLEHSMSSAIHEERAFRELTPEEDEELLTHCKEDAKVAGMLANKAMFIMRQSMPAREPILYEMMGYAEPWYHMCKNPIHLDVEYLDASRNLPALLQRGKKHGIDFFEIGDDGRLHQNAVKTQQWMERENVGLVQSMRTPYAKKHQGQARGWRKTYFEEIVNGNTARTNEFFTNLGRSVEDKALVSNLILLLLNERWAKKWNQQCVHAEILCAQASGRFSPKGSPLAQGPYRPGVIPPEGMKTLSLDIKAQEPHLCAEFSGDTVFQSDLGKDIYSAQAATVRGTPYVELPKGDPFRSLMKNGLTLPHIYGVGPQTCAEKMNLTLQGAQTYLARLRARYHVFEDWRLEVIEKATNCGTVQTMFHHYPLTVRYGRQNPRQTVNHVVQGSGCDMLREWVVFLQENGYMPFHTLHDGVYLYVDRDFDSNSLAAMCGEMFDERFPIFRPWTVEVAEFYPGQVFRKEKFDFLKEDYVNVKGRLLEKPQHIRLDITLQEEIGNESSAPQTS